MLFDLIGLTQEWVDENNIPPSDDCFDLIPERNPTVEIFNEQKHDDSKPVKPRILMLHAYKQNGKIFRSRSKKFVKPLLDHFELSFPNAPFKLNGTPSCPNPY